MLLRKIVLYCLFLMISTRHDDEIVDIQWHGRKIVQKDLNQAKSKEFLAD